MLFLLREPELLLGVALALLVGIVVHCLAQAYVASRFGDRWARAAGRLSPDPRKHFEPYGVVAMVVSGIGWNKPVPMEEPRFRGGRGRYALGVLAGPLANLLLAVLAVVGLRLSGLTSVGPLDIDTSTSNFGTTLLLQFAYVNAAVGVLTLVPLPPLDGARLLWLYAPPTEGWRRARYYLDEQHWGTGIVLVTILPLFGGAPLLLRIVGAVSGPFLELVFRAVGISI